MIETTAEIVNTNQLKTSLSHQITRLKENLNSENISLEEIVKLFQTTLLEREFLLAEIDSLRSRQDTYEATLRTKSHPSVIILSDIEENLYNDFQNLARKLSMTDGEILNLLMSIFLNQITNDRFPRVQAKELVKMVKGVNTRLEIKNHTFVRVTNKDLLNICTKIDFKEIKKLTLEISPENFVKYVISINYCQVVHILTKVSKLMVYARTSNCQEIHFAPLPSESCLEYAKEANQVVEAWNNGN